MEELTLEEVEVFRVGTNMWYWKDKKYSNLKTKVLFINIFVIYFLTVQSSSQNHEDILQKSKKILHKDKSDWVMNV